MAPLTHTKLDKKPPKNHILKHNRNHGMNTSWLSTRKSANTEKPNHSSKLREQ